MIMPTFNYGTLMLMLLLHMTVTVHLNLFPVAHAYSNNADANFNNIQRQQQQQQEYSSKRRPLTPPFPNGLNNGRLVTLPPSHHYKLDTNLSGNTLLLPPRDIQVWLPPDYDKYPNMKFPVLYCHDGQNAFDDSTSWTGYSWRLTGALTRLAERKLLTQTTSTYSPPIVVSIPSSDERIANLIPRRHLEYGDISQSFAISHTDFVAKTLKPLIDNQFRTKSDVENTAVIGTSLGGQASMHLVLRYPDLFGKVACLSPAFQPSILSSIATLQSNDEQLGLLQQKTIYMDNGGDDDVSNIKVPYIDVVDFMSKLHWWNPGYWWLDSQLQVGIDAMKLALDLKQIDYNYLKFPGGRHNERAWARRIHQPLLVLFGDGTITD
mmetsp:Transcript_25237/g.29208  ORF Transcript_25237/g.29208 Transcript_25237/m.29208 type:complete len:378 (+) Transcript_25237:413-1546(+)